MTARYDSSTNTLNEIAEIEEPLEPMAICYPQDERGYERAVRHYNIELSEYKNYVENLRRISCAKICQRLFIDGAYYEESTDYKLCGDKDGKGVMAFPVIKDEDEPWKEAAFILTDRNAEGLTKEDNGYWIKWREYYTALCVVKEKGYKLVLIK